MAHDVFISHSTKDKKVSDAACALLEQRGYRCWLAPRDILPGQEWGEAIIDGISDAQVFVLIFSDNANTSQQVRREVERAVGHGIPIVPFRIEDVAPVRSLEYFISNQHWLDALTPPIERHLERLADTVGRLLASGKRGPPAASAGSLATESVRPGRNWPFWIAMSIVLVSLAGGGAYWLNRGATEDAGNETGGNEVATGNQAAPVLSEPLPMVSLIDLASIPLQTEADGEIEARDYLERAAIPVEIVSVSPSNARLAFIASDQINAFQDSALPSSRLLALVDESNEYSQTFLELRFAQPVSEVRLTRPAIGDPGGPGRALRFPSMTIVALDENGLVVAEATQRSWDQYPSHYVDPMPSVNPGPPRVITLRSSRPEGIRTLRIRTEGTIWAGVPSAAQLAPAPRAGEYVPPPPPPPPPPRRAAFILEDFAARRNAAPAPPAR